MRIYSIKEIVEATNNILKSDSNIESTKSFEKINIQATPKNSKTPLILDKEIPRPINNKKNSFNYQIKIKPEIKDNIVSELYYFLKKKVKKNTLKIIIDEQIEIKNLRNRVNFLKQNKDKLLSDYKDLEKKYKIITENYEKIKNRYETTTINRNELKNKNKKLKDDLDKIYKENKELISENNELEINNNELQTNIDIIRHENSGLSIEIKDLKSEIKNKDLYLDSMHQKNSSFEINNSELKNTISKHIANSKKLEEKLKYLEKSNNIELEEKNKKIKFYQDENVRLSGELLSSQKSSERIKLNLSDIEMEKEKISNKIKELNRSIDEKRNVISTNFVKKDSNINDKNLEHLNDKEQKSLDEVISRIFKKL
tara:strand:- start:3516 stop:4625 length:1110 start_codon:yes stop_codon:yes gene_type:complete